MKLVWLFLFLFLLLLLLSQVSRADDEVLNIGAIFCFGTINGRVSKIAMAAAIEDVNSDPTILANTKLHLSTHDSNYSGFRSIIGGLQYMKTPTVAIIGPQTSGMARSLSRLANELTLPMLSFTALDPTLISLQYPYFIQTAPNDLAQMTAIADLLSYYSFREVVVVAPDDEHTRGSMAALTAKLAENRCRVSYRANLSPESLATRDEITNELVRVSLMGSRVIIVHAFSVIGLEVFSVAYELGMMDMGYVWIATSWLSTVLDSTRISEETAKTIQGVITLRPHTPDSERKQAFLKRWDELSNGSIRLNPYGLYAYDTVWMIANAIEAFKDDGGAISFSNGSSLDGAGGGLIRFEGGKKLLTYILKSNSIGLTGRVGFDGDKSVISPSFDVLNAIGEGYKHVGYWSKYSSLSVEPPERLYREARSNVSRSSEQLQSVMWPGKTTKKPRGWVFPQNERRLRIGVPDRVSYKAFVSRDDETNEIHGYCIDVFLAALHLLPYALPYEFILFGDKRGNPSYTDLINLIATNELDAAVGDITIVSNRTKVVDFTQPYTESGLVIVAPVLRKMRSSPWAFMSPFSLSMWLLTGTFSILVAAVVSILEHKSNDEFRGPPKKQLTTMLWFGFSTMFFAHRENTLSTLGRVILVIWLFLVLILTSNYTANLTSDLTVEHLVPSINGMDSLMSRQDLLIGFPLGSFAENYLKEELNIPESRLIPLTSPQQYAEALNTQRVAAIVDERPYIDLFLSLHCIFQVVGQQFTKSGWGFAFPRDSPLVTDMSTAILTLSENGELQKIHDKWLIDVRASSCSATPTSVDSEKLDLKSFWALFLICGIASFLALLLYLSSTVYKFKRRVRSRSGQPTTNNPVGIQNFIMFMDTKEEEETTKWRKANK